jgi:glutaconate CoA-transferase subunit A
MRAAHPGGVGRQRVGGLGHNYRRAVERGVPYPIEVEDHSNLTIAAALQAGAMGAPYMPTRSLLGTGLLDSNPTFKQARDPFSGDPGGAHPRPSHPTWPSCTSSVRTRRSRALLGHARHHAPGRARPAKRVIIVARRSAPAQILLSDPGLVLAPGLKVARSSTSPSAPIRHRAGLLPRGPRLLPPLPRGVAHREGHAAWLERWVYGVADWKGFLDRLGPDAQRAVRITTPRPSEPLDYGA